MAETVSTLTTTGVVLAASSDPLTITGMGTISSGSKSAV